LLDWVRGAWKQNRASRKMSRKTEISLRIKLGLENLWGRSVHPWALAPQSEIECRTLLFNKNTTMQIHTL
jgi:hypothetical protein